MEVFNKLYSQVSSSVSNTVSQLSGVLPGNPVTREFDATCHIASGGPGLLWKIYKGFKRSTKQEAAIFVLEKRQLEKYSKSDRELILEGLKRGITQLTKIRHPRILTVQHPLEESRESLAFATEPVFASLANILGQTNNMPQPANISDYKFYDIEMKYGLLQLGEGLAFLHNDVKLLHKNICPESVIVNQQGAWKIFGFDFCIHNSNPANSAPLYTFQAYNFSMPSVTQPLLDYLPPEAIIAQTNTTATDLFSLGMLIHALYSVNKQPFMPAKDLQQYKSKVQQLKQLSVNKLQCLPDSLREYVRMMSNVAPESRPDAHQFVKIPFFEDVGVKTLMQLDSLLQWDNLQKSQFYKGLPDTLAKLPQRVRLQQVLPCLVRDLAQPAMIPFVLPSILDIAQHCNEKEFIASVLPHLKPVMLLMDPIQILLIFLQRMELLLKLTPADDIQKHVLPMLYRGLDADSPQIHELCLSVLPTFANLLDHGNVKNSVLPRVKRLCLSTSTLSVRVNCLLCIGRLLENFDKWLVLDEVLPFLPQIPSREPAVLMGILGIYKIAMTHKKLGITKEVMATRVLPFLMPLCIENGLNLSQFNALVAVVKLMVQQVETEHRSKLEQLNSVQEQQKALENSMPTVVSSIKAGDVNPAFSGLGLDNFSSSLKLEEKQKATQQQEALKVFQNQPVVLNPTPIVQNKNLNQTKDLSSMLTNVSSNLMTSSSSSQSMMATNTNNNLKSPPQATLFNSNNNVTPVKQPQLGSFQSSNGNMGQNSQFGSYQASNVNLGQNPQFASFQSSNLGTNQQFGSFQSNNGNMGQNSWLTNNVSMSHQWSSPNQNRNFSNIPSNTPLLAPTQTLQPTSTTSLNNSRTNTSLSKDEIMDLLS